MHYKYYYYDIMIYVLISLSTIVSVESRNSIGGTSKARVLEQITTIRQR